MCTIPGEVPNFDQTGCIVCPSTKIASNGQCVDCPTGKIPNDDHTNCFEEDIQCPNNCTNSSQGTCNKMTGVCSCKNQFDCPGKGSFNIYVNTEGWVGGQSIVYVYKLNDSFCLLCLFTRGR